MNRPLVEKNTADVSALQKTRGLSELFRPRRAGGRVVDRQQLSDSREILQRKLDELLHGTARLDATHHDETKRLLLHVLFLLASAVCISQIISRRRLRDRQIMLGAHESRAQNTLQTGEVLLSPPKTCVRLH